MKDDELRDFVKKQVSRIIDELYSNISGASNLKPESKYSFNITVKSPFSNKVISKKLTFQGDEVIALRDFINNNKVKASAIKRILKKEAWKIAYAAVKEGISLK